MIQFIDEQRVENILFCLSAREAFKIKEKKEIFSLNSS